MLRPATVARRPAVDVFSSPNGLAWTFQATLHATAGFTALMANGGPDGVAVTGQAGRNLTAFASADGQTWHQARPFGTAAAEDVSGVALAPDGAVVTAGVSDTPDGRQPVIALTGANAAAQRVDIAKIPGAVEPQVAVNSIAAQGGTQVAVGSANGYPAAWTSGNGGSSWTRAVGALPAVLGRPGSQRLTSVTHGPMGWLAVGDVTAAAPEHPVVVVSADGTSWQAADGERVFGAPGLFTEQAAANTGGYVIVGHQNVKQVQNGRVVSARTEAAVWWSATLTGWQRAGDATAGALDGTGDRQMTAVTASGSGFVAVGSHGNQPSAWTSADGGRTWRLADLPLPVGSTRAVLEHVASAGRVVVAVGTAVTTAGRPVPFAASSADGGASWAESALPVPAGLTSVTALAAAGGSFTATGTYGSTPGHQDVVVWTSTDGSAWRAAEPAGQGLTGPGVQAITGLAVAGSTLAGVGLHRLPARRAARLLAVPGQVRVTAGGGPNTSSRRLARLGRLARTVPIRPVSTSATVTEGAGPRSARTTPSGSTSMLRPMPVAARVGRSSGSGTWPTAATHMVFSMARARTSVTQCSSLNSPAAHAAGSTSSSAPATASARDSSPNRTS